MDNHQRSANSLIWKKVFLSLTICGVLYISIVRPLQSLLIHELIYPAIQKSSLVNKKVKIEPGEDELQLITQRPQLDQRTKVELPFNGYFWLTLGLLGGVKNKKLVTLLLLYQIVLFIVMPLFLLLILKGHGWIVIITNLHERLYKVLFLIVGLLAVRDSVLTQSGQEVP